MLRPYKKLELARVNLSEHRCKTVFSYLEKP